MKRCEYESAGNERQSRWYARKKGRPLGLTEHRYQRNAEKDVSGRKRHILPGTVADLQKQMLHRVHRLPSIERHAAEASNPASWPNRIGCWVFARARYDPAWQHDDHGMTGAVDTYSIEFDIK
jgi:hypothetical protein